MGIKNSKKKNRKNNKKRKKKNWQKNFHKENLKNEIIGDMLDRDEENAKNQIKLLILGTGDSGKSTFVKQIELLYKEGFDQRKRKLFKKAIRINLVKHIYLLIQASSVLNIKFSEENLSLAAKFSEMAENFDENLGEADPKTYKMVKKLWADPKMKEVFSQRSEFQIPDSAAFYLNSIKRIIDENYIPTDEDILKCRIPTTGIKEVNFKINNVPWKIVDVGGQRSERRKWIHQFSDVTVIIYVVALSEYNQKLYEDESVNRMQESLNLFDSTANNKIFVKTNCVLLFNKIDIFEKKIEEDNLNSIFSDYDGGLDFEKAKTFITNKFIDKGKNSLRKIFPFFTIATKTNSVKEVFDEIQSKILEENLKGMGVIEKL
ncbi:guanine nucleotide-binding protein g(o) subunit alpha [Anaeramoeba flamelloides]|uniref:Guanine nucleotide-binding protein g(O) subunit alpha n=1 Tax=Anaeramoeba flamelloides TaxID=1746091 RepID=A0AAV7Y6N0_9EUKA|nr:guanine nucleotide-binding protein g(o) subunit alpha [Anaeramoeba flamelloides]KAJ6234534.1 guanine nucleotide-binding protein g(o) subunit alpha [Anaeramoeba flamelloides]